MSSSRTTIASLTLASLALAATGAAAAPSAPPSPPPSRLDPVEVAAFADAFMATAMPESHAPGAALAVVQDGAVVLAKGYGLADIQQRTPFGPDTIVRAGSISKVVTATAAMQLVEEGRLDLDADVNSYLKEFRLPATFPRPVTMRHLLTHTGGFGDTVIGGHAPSAAAVQPLAEYLPRHMPPRSWPPGEMISYSDHGITLAGYAVECITGRRLAEVAEERICKPLGMTRSGFDLPSELRRQTATGYRFAGGELEAYPYDYVNVAPAAGFDTTANDIARFMVAHLQEGRVGDVRILKPETAREMHARQFANHPTLRGRALGFSELRLNGRRVIFHDGAMPGFNSRMLLLPDDGIGLFVVWNSSPMALKHALTSAFFDHTFPVPAATPPPTPSAELLADARRCAGTYREVNYSWATLEKIHAPFSQVPVRVRADGTLSFGSAPAWLVPVEPLLFQFSDGQGYVAFRTDTSAGVTHMFAGTGSFERISTLETVISHPAFYAALALVFLACIALAVRRLAWPRRAATALPVVLLGVVALLHLAFMVGMGIMLGATDMWILFRGLPTSVVILLAFPLIAAALTAVLIWHGARAWRNGTGSRLGRTLFTLATLVMAAQVFVLHYWNLLGFRY